LHSNRVNALSVRQRTAWTGVGTDAVLFVAGGAQHLIVDPGAVFVSRSSVRSGGLALTRQASLADLSREAGEVYVC
jgi:hypothetical protein